METPFDNRQTQMQEGGNNPQPQMQTSTPQHQPQMEGQGQQIPNPHSQMQEGGNVFYEDNPMESGGEVYEEPIEDGRISLNWGLVFTFFK